MNKRLVFPGNAEKERDLFFVKEDRNYLRKHASAYHPEISKYIENAKPLPDLVQVLLTALGAFPFWPQNVNGDRFYEQPLAFEGDSHGYKTFQTNGNYFTHHVNKDPALAKGKVLHSVWNDKAKRVELVVGIDVNKDPEATDAIDRGEDLCFSMGCKVPYDVCSICANKAKTRADYCEHLKYLMNQMDPETGKLVGAVNTLPRFFDISRVLIPADKTAYMWQKVASAANPFKKLSSAFLAELPPGKIADTKYLMDKVAEQESYSKTAVSKKAAVKKSATITKQVPALLPTKTMEHLQTVIPAAKSALQADEPLLPPEALAKLREIAPSIEHILTTMLSLGVEPQTDELKALGADILAAPPSINPSLFHDESAHVLFPFLPERSYARPFLVRRIVLLAKKLEEKPELVKKANILYKPPGTPQISKGLVAGMAAAIYALLGESFIAAHPLFSVALGITGIATLNSFKGTRESGYFDVDPRGPGAYNNSWQRSLAYSQAHPVTVIKTGAADQTLTQKAFYGLPSLFVASGLTKHSSDQSTGNISTLFSEHSDLLRGGLLKDLIQGDPVSEIIKSVTESGERLFKQANLQNLDFLSAVPEEHQSLFWDLAILDSAQRIQKKLGG